MEQKKTSTSKTARVRRGGSARTGNTLTRAGKGAKKKNYKRRTNKRPQQRANRVEHASLKKSTIKLPDLERDTVRVVPLGGVEEVGRNMLALEYNDDIIVFDVGFQFEEEGAPGVDYVLPNTQYLEDRKDKIRAVIITHGHLDHIGGLPYIMPIIGNPPLYTRALTSYMIKKRQEEFPNAEPMEMNLVEPGDKLKLGALTVEFFHVTHSIPDSMGISVHTPLGNVVVSGDLRLDHVDGEPTDAEKKVWGAVGKNNNLLFIADSTNAEQPGFSIPESKIVQNLEEIIRDIKGRIIVGTFASQFARMVELIRIAEKVGRKVVVDGRSIKTNIEIAKKAGMLKNVDKIIIPVEDLKDYPPSKILILATGAQGEEFAALNRIANKQHKFISFTNYDTIILSSSVIPGNEISVQRLKDNLYRHGVKIIHYRVSDVHASGHGRIEELKWINKQVGAKYFMPAYGYHSMLRMHAEAMIENGFPRENVIVADNGMLIDIAAEGMHIHERKAPSQLRVVEGAHVRDIQEAVMRDRTELAKDGIFVVVATINLRTGKLKKSPDIASRGFIYLRESQELLGQTRLIIKKTIEDELRRSRNVDVDELRNDVIETVSRFLQQQTNKNPIVMAVIVGV